MATTDGFPPDGPYPVFLSERAKQPEPEQPDIGEAWASAAVRSRILKTGILVVAATAIGIAFLSVGNPVAILADVTASLLDKSALQAGTDRLTSEIQAIAGTQDVPPAVGEAPNRGETTVPRAAEIGQTPAEGLLNQFQAWAADKDTRAQVGPAQPEQDAPVRVDDAPAQAVQDAPAQATQDPPTQVVQDAPAQARSMKRHRQFRHLHNARAEIRSERHSRTKASREHHPRRERVQRDPDARAEVPPAVSDARAQDQSVQNSQIPWLPQGFGWRN